MGLVTVAVDFDKVIHKYSKGWFDGTIYDEPVEGAIEAIEQMMRQGWSVHIFATREPEEILKWMVTKVRDCFYSISVIPKDAKFWNEKRHLGITNRKLPAMYYIDDRAIRFEDWKQAMHEVTEMVKYEEVSRFSI